MKELLLLDLHLATLLDLQDRILRALHLGHISLDHASYDLAALFFLALNWSERTWLFERRRGLRMLRFYFWSANLEFRLLRFNAVWFFKVCRSWFCGVFVVCLLNRLLSFDALGKVMFYLYSGSGAGSIWWLFYIIFEVSLRVRLLQEKGVDVIGFDGLKRSSMFLNLSHSLDMGLFLLFFCLATSNALGACNHHKIVVELWLGCFGHVFIGALPLHLKCTVLQCERGVVVRFAWLKPWFHAL